MEVLVVDIGGTRMKIRATTSEEILVAPTGPEMTPEQMIKGLNALTNGWRFDVVSLGYPGEVRDGRPSRDPNNLGPGWVEYDYREALGRPIRIVNDAAMQALGSYEGGRMLFLGLGTGLGSALVIHGTVQAMELSQLPYKDGRTFGDVLGQRGLNRVGLPIWQREVGRVVGLLRDALVVDYTVLGGGNVQLLQHLPLHCRPGHNDNAFKGGFRLWTDPGVRA